MVGWLQRSSVQATAVRLPSLHQREEAASPGESIFCRSAPALHPCSPTAVIVRRSMSSAVGAMHTMATGDRSGDAPHRLRRSLHVYRRSSLPGCRCSWDSSGHPVACSPRHMSAAAPERASRHLEARSYEDRQATPQCISAMLPHVVAHRPALPQRLPSSTNASGKTPKRNLAVACALSATDPDIAQILPHV